MSLDRLGEKLYGQPIFRALEAPAPTLLRRIREFGHLLDNAGYHEEEVCALLGVSSLLVLDPDDYDYYDRQGLPQTPLANLIRLFLLDSSLAGSTLEQTLPAQTVELLAELGVIVPAGEMWHSQVHIHCVRDRLLATDTGRYSPIWPQGEALADRVMYIGYDSVGLSCVAPVTPGGRTLDLCCGSGIQGIMAASASREVVGIDLNPRAVRFSRFNAALSGVDNARFAVGDLLEPIQGQVFDTILANPPFVPYPDVASRLLYRDGGPTGESVLQTLVCQGPAHLAENGCLSIVTDLVNLDGLPQRLQQWRVPDAPPVDVLVLVERALPMARYAAGHSVHLDTRQDRREHIRMLLEHYRQAGIKTLHSGYIVIRRLQKGTEGSFHIVHTSESITHTVSDHVSAYMTHRDAVRSGARARARVELADGLGIKISRLFDHDDEQKRIEIVPSGAHYFPTMEISDALYKLLLAVRELRPRWIDIYNNNTADLCDHLLLCGVLRLTELP